MMKNILFVANGLPAEETRDAFNSTVEKAGLGSGRVLLAHGLAEGSVLWEKYSGQLLGVVTDWHGGPDVVTELIDFVRAHDQHLPIAVVTDDPKGWREHNAFNGPYIYPVYRACPVIVSILQQHENYAQVLAVPTSGQFFTLNKLLQGLGKSVHVTKSMAPARLGDHFGFYGFAKPRRPELIFVDHKELELFVRGFVKFFGEQGRDFLKAPMVLLNTAQKKLKVSPDVAAATNIASVLNSADSRSLEKLKEMVKARDIAEETQDGFLTSPAFARALACVRAGKAEPVLLGPRQRKGYPVLGPSL